ncbi:MAG: hypothetical protein AMXMBFR82_06990 [Candidatus Hydrogenedentota bacterium]
MSVGTGIRTLAIHIDYRGFGYIVLEGGNRLVDWGTKQTTGAGRKKTLDVVADLVVLYQPDYVLLEDLIHDTHRRSARAVLLTRKIAIHMVESGKDCRLVPTELIKSTFRRWGANTKQERANLISRQLPVLEPRLPPPRKPWMSEDARMSIFSAATVALTFLDNYRFINAPQTNRDQDEA